MSNSRTNRETLFRRSAIVAVLVALAATGRHHGLAAQQEEGRAERLAKLTDHQRLFARGTPRIYEGEYLDAIRIPIGGVGTGAIHMDGQGRRMAWQLWRNFTDFPLPHSFVAVRAKVGDNPPVVRVLQTAPEGPLQAMKSLKFRGEYPFGWYTFHDPALPVEVRMEAFSPLIPLDERHSALPCAIFRLTAENRGEQPAEVSFLATQQNAAGLVETLPPDPVKGRRRAKRPPSDDWTVKDRYSDQYGGNTNTVLRKNAATLLHLTGDKAKDAPDYGEMVLAVTEPDAQATASWTTLEALATEFLQTGGVSGPESAGPTPKGETVDGALAVPFVLQPGEKRTVCFVLTWYFPNIPQVPDENRPLWIHHGHVYGSWWPSGLAVAEYILARLDDLTQQSRLYHDCLYQSNLPYWLLDRISSQVAILSSQTCFWAKDGHFGCWEGCLWTFGSCAGNPTHVWGYAQAVPRLFPEIGRIMREQEHDNQTPEGMLPCRLGLRKNQLYQAFDGQCHSILGSYLGHLLTEDGRWLDRQWPKIKQSMNYVIAGWDEDEDGMLSGPQHGMDSEHGGTSSWMGSMYLAAVAAARQMALVQNEVELAERYARILRVGAKNQDEGLFNGEYFIQIPDPTPLKDYNTGCYTDQMLGQWWAQLVDLGWIYPKEHVRSAMRALFDYNFRTHFHGFTQSPRKFVVDDEAAMVQCTWPRGGRPEPEHTMLHADEVKVGISYSVAALMIRCGLLNEAFAVTQANADRYDGRLRTELDNSPWGCWGYSGNPFGDDCAGKFYVRALSTWSLLLACQGQIYNGPENLLGFDPAWQPEDHVSFFTTAKGWGLFSQRRSKATRDKQSNETTQEENISLKWGTLKLRRLVFVLPDDATPGKVAVSINGNSVEATQTAEERRLYIDLSETRTLEAGDVLTVSIALH